LAVFTFSFLELHW